MPGTDGNTNASKRKQLAQEALRVKIDGGRCIDDLEVIDQQLAQPDANVAALKARADIKFGLLKKILPDLRSVEWEADEETKQALGGLAVLWGNAGSQAPEET